MSDIVERLREQAMRRSGGPKMDAAHVRMLEWEAASEIEQLRAQVERLTAALTQFVAACDTAPPTSLMIEIGMASKAAKLALSSTENNRG